MPEGKIFMVSYGDQLGTVKFEMTNIHGMGGSDFPLLTITTNFVLTPFRDQSQAQQRLLPISLLHLRGEFRSPENRIVARFQDDVALNAHPNNQFPASTQVVFEIPLTLTTISRIERAREGKDLRVQLRFQLLFALHQPSPATLTFHSGRIDDLVFVIPRSQWVDHILPGLGYGGLELLEIRYSDALIARNLPASVEEIQQAKKALFEGHHDKAALHCRKAIELILLSTSSTLPVPPNFPQRVDTFVHDNLPNVDDAEAKLLAGQMKHIWAIASSGAHPTPHIFKRPDSEFIVRTTMALVEYFSRILS